MSGLAAPTAVAQLIADLSPVGLAELDEVAALQRRSERKYVVPLEALPGVLQALPAGCRVLQIDGGRSFRYRSVYFDDGALHGYHDTARRRPTRVKVRTRTYLDSRLCLLECKARSRTGTTVKHRRPRPALDAHRLSAEDAAFVQAWWRHGSAADLRAVLRTSYRRTTLLAPDGSRATLDHELTWDDGITLPLRLERSVVIETKSPGHPTAVDRGLWSLGIRPTPISKFGTGLAALRPDLPANRWAQTLRIHVGR